MKKLIFIALLLTIGFSSPAYSAAHDNKYFRLNTCSSSSYLRDVQEHTITSNDTFQGPSVSVGAKVITRAYVYVVASNLTFYHACSSIENWSNVDTDNDGFSNGTDSHPYDSSLPTPILCDYNPNGTKIKGITPYQPTVSNGQCTCNDNDVYLPTLSGSPNTASGCYANSACPSNGTLVNHCQDITNPNWQGSVTRNNSFLNCTATAQPNSGFSSGQPQRIVYTGEESNLATNVNPAECVTYDPHQDPDGDFIENDDDNCSDDHNPNQQDSDGDGIGDVCDIIDTDNDNIPDNLDNCPNDPNPNQIDSDQNGVGDVCDTHCVGLSCGSNDTPTSDNSNVFNCPPFSASNPAIICGFNSLPSVSQPGSPLSDSYNPSRDQAFYSSFIPPISVDFDIGNNSCANFVVQSCSEHSPTPFCNSFPSGKNFTYDELNQSFSAIASLTKYFTSESVGSLASGGEFSRYDYLTNSRIDNTLSDYIPGRPIQFKFYHSFNSHNAVWTKDVFGNNQIRDVVSTTRLSSSNILTSTLNLTFLDFCDTSEDPSDSSSGNGSAGDGVFSTDCDVQPECENESTIECANLLQTWNHTCSGGAENVTDCDVPFQCQSRESPYRCSQLEVSRAHYCEIKTTNEDTDYNAEITSLFNQIDSQYSGITNNTFGQIDFFTNFSVFNYQATCPSITFSFSWLGDNRQIDALSSFCDFWDSPRSFGNLEIPPIRKILEYFLFLFTALYIYHLFTSSSRGV